MILPNTRNIRARARRGAVLVFALFVVLMIGVLSMSYMQMSLNKTREQEIAADAKRAFYIAEAGLAEAHAALLEGKSGNVASDIVPARFGTGLFWVTADDLGNSNTCLTSTGLSGRGRACVSIVVQNQSQSVASLGVFSDESLTIRAGSLVDSYDSRLGSYALQQVGGAVNGSSNGNGNGNASNNGNGHGNGGALVATSGTSTVIAGARVASNGNVRLQGTTPRSTGAQVVGDVQPGPQGIVDRGTGATVTGATAPNTAAVELPDVEIPAVEARDALVLSRAGQTYHVPMGSIGYSKFEVAQGAEAAVRGPTTLVVDELVVDPGGRLSIDASRGAVKIFVRDWLRCAAGSTITFDEEVPTNCVLVCTGQTTTDRDGDGLDDPPVTLAATSEFHGLVFAPHASVTVPNTFHVFGAISAKNLVIDYGGRVHFDRAFLAATSADLALARELCWRSVQLPPCAIVEQRGDPFLFLKLRGVNPPAAKDAHYARGVAVPTAITREWKRKSTDP